MNDHILRNNEVCSASDWEHRATWLWAESDRILGPILTSAPQLSDFSKLPNLSASLK